MAKILAYSVQTPGHVYPFVPILQELQRRKHAVVFAMFQHEARSTIGGIRVRPVTAPVSGPYGGEAQELTDSALAPITESLSPK